MDSALYWTNESPRSGWRLLREDNGTWKAERLDGPQALTGPNVNDVLRQLAGEDAALNRRYTEAQIATAAVTAGLDPVVLSSALRGLSR